MKKRILAVILCVLMIVTMLPTWALAEEVQEQAAPEEAVTEVRKAESAAVEEPEPVIQETNVEAEETSTEIEETSEIPETTEKEPSTEPAVEEPAPAEPETAEAEEKTEPADEVDDGSENEPAETEGEEAAQDETATDSENEEELGVQNVDDAAEDEKVRVTFQLDPPDATLTVYTLDENEEKQVIEPEEDGTYLLLPGEYYFDVDCEGYEKESGSELKIKEEGMLQTFNIILQHDEDEAVIDLAAISLEGDSYLQLELDETNIVTPGTIRYVQQTQGRPYFYNSYWGNNLSAAGYQCNLASYSMALSYIGINKLPANMQVYWIPPSGLDGTGATMSNPASVSAGIDRMISSNGKYSPVLIHMQYYSENNWSEHWVVVAGRKSNNIYYIVDPAYGIGMSAYYTGEINGNTLIVKGSESTIVDFYQFYNPNSSGIMIKEYIPFNSIIEVKSGSTAWLKSMPVSGEANQDSYNVVPDGIPAGTRMLATQKVKNIYDNYWYEVEITSGPYAGNKGYILAELTTEIEHIHNKGTYKFTWDLHPHYKCYQCSVCGEVWHNTDEPTERDGCDICFPVITAGAGRTIPDGDYLIALASNPSWFIDISGNAVPAANGTNVQLYGPLDSEPLESDIWTITYIDEGGYYKILQKGTNISLDVYDGSRSNGANIQVYTYYSSADAQKWSIAKNSNGSYRIQPKCSGRCLDLRGADVFAGNNIQQYGAADTIAQQWTFIPYGNSGALCQHTPGVAVRENEIEASCKVDGSYDSVVYCTQCGEELSRETKIIPKLPHSTELRNKVEATCTSTGYTGDEVCINCGDIINAGTTVAAFGHSWGEWTVTKAATCTEKGTETRTCAHDSNHKETKEIAALGHNYVNGVCTRAGCGERDPGYAVDTTGKLIVSAAKGRPGDEVTVNVSIAENPGIMVLNLGFDYDRTSLSYVGFEDAGFTDWTVASNAVWLGNSNSSFNGVILKLKFKILDNAPEGDAYVTVTCGDGDMADQNETVYIPSIQAGKVTVFTTLPGDINGDGKVNALDLVRLKRAIAGENVELVGSGDTTGDGKINALDLVRLKRYLAGENVELH